MASRGKLPSTQQHLAIGQIRDDLVVMRDGAFRAVIVVSAVNFALKSQDEQNSIIYQFQNFLNSLEFPLQIVVQSRQLDLSQYLQQLVTAADGQTNELLQVQTADYIDFVARLIDLANIMDKRFYVVVPYERITVQKGLFDMFLGGRKTAPVYTESQFAQIRTHMEERVNVTISGLAGLGLRAVRLNTQELVAFYYSVYNPEESSTERVTESTAIRAGVIHRGKEAGNG